MAWDGCFGDEVCEGGGGGGGVSDPAARWCLNRWSYLNAFLLDGQIVVNRLRLDTADKGIG